MGFCGSWSVRRRVLDARTGQVTRFEGTALISPLHFAECGLVQHGGQTFAASRRYRLIFGEREIQVFFPDGRPFIALVRASAQRVQHICGEDRYRGRFLFADADLWTESWSVLGPRKDYRSLARYRRIAPSDPSCPGE